MSGNQMALIGASNGGSDARVVVVTSSTTFFAPISGWYVFEAWGGGASGATLQGQTTTGGIVTGGTAGGYCYKRVWLEAGAAVLIMIGAGGAGVSGDNIGNFGSDTTVLLSGTIDLTAVGGSPGEYTATNGASVGGSAVSGSTGGDINKDPQSSNNCGPFVTGAMIALGGGSPPTFEHLGGVSSGTFTGTLLSTSRIAFGGASVNFGSAALAVGTSVAGGGAGTGTQYGAATNNGGKNWALAASPAIDGTTTPMVSSGISLPVGALSSVIHPARRLYGGGSDGTTGVSTTVTSGVSGPGCGSGGAIETGTSGSNPATSGNAGTFGGSGGVVNANTSGGAATSGAPGRGAGSGGAISYNASGAASSANGGDGLVIIQMEAA